MKGVTADSVTLVVRHHTAWEVLTCEAIMEEPIIDDDARQGLQQAIGLLYQTFSRYPLNHNMRACPCCVDHLDKRLLFRTGLQGSAQDLARYASEALYTWGNADDFRHFLPRLFELQVSTAPSPIEGHHLFGKLPYAKWRTWPDEEQRAIESFLMAWGRCLVATYPANQIPDYLLVLAVARVDMTPFLEVWRAAEAVPALRNLAMVARMFVNRPDMFRDVFWAETPLASEQIETWFRDPATEARLIEVYFRFEAEPFAEEFASAVDALGWSHP